MIAKQDFLILPPGAANTVDVERAPVQHTCTCRRHQTIVPPNHPGAVVWLCPSCNKPNRLDFVHEEAGWSDQGRFELGRAPIQHQCQNEMCQSVDMICLPAGGGEMRWQCACGKIWMLEFKPNGQARLAEVRRS